MCLYPRYEWNLTSSQAIALQKQLAAEVVSNRSIDLHTMIAEFLPGIGASCGI